MPNTALGLTYASYKDEAFLTANMQIWLRDRAVDQIFNGVTLFKWLSGRDQTDMTLDQVQSKGTLEYRDGGQSIDVPLLTGSNSTVQSYHQYQTIDTTPQQGIGPAMIDWREYAVTVTISKFEELVNMDSKSRVINLLQTKQVQAEKSIIDRLNSDCWKGDPSGTTGAPGGKTNTTDIEGIPYWVQGNPTFAASVAGIAQGTYSFWRNQYNAAGEVVAATNPSFAAEGKNDIQLQIMEASGGPGLDEVDALFTTKTIFNYLWDSLEDMRRYSSGDVGDVGYKRLSFQGLPVYWDSALTAACVYGLNSDYFKLVVHRDAFLKSDGFRQPTNQTAKTAIIMAMLNLVCMSRRRQFIISNIAA
jgi:hypothetical protein